MPETLVAGRYRLDSLLGRGGMSEVWAATDLELGRRVALKLLAPHEDNARFEREARAVAALAHPNVTQLYDYGEAAGRPFMVLEYLPGGSLEDLLRTHGVLADGETRTIATEVAGGLAHAHSRGVVHRDLKPSNVLFDEERRAKLSDFGIARMAAGEGTLTEAGTVLGTAAYISPEQAMGMPATPASDVYSFGVLLFRMLTGRLPFESEDPFALVVAHRDSPPPLVADLRPTAPAALAALAAATLEKDPAARPHDGSALMAALAGGAGATEVTRVIPAAAPPRSRRSPFVAPLVSAIAILLALGGGILAYAVTRTHDPASTPPTTLPGATLARKHHLQAATSTTAPATTTLPASTTAPTTTYPATTTAPTTTRRRRTTTLPIVPPPPPTAATTTVSYTTTALATTTASTTTGMTTTTAPTTAG